MKKKALMTELDDMTARVEFPKSNSPFEKFRDMLREVVRENLGYSESKSLAFDEFEQRFYFEVSEVCAIGGKKCGVNATFLIDPHKTIESEIKRVAREVEDFKLAARSMHPDYRRN